MAGWISLHRQIQEHELWQDKPFSRGQAWIDILLMVNHQDEKIMFDGNITIVKRGSRITSIRKLCERWGWSNSKVIKFLKLLQDEKMLDYISDKKKTVLTVVNYGSYQNEDTLKRHRNTTETPLKHTNNNDNNDNNDNKIYSLVIDYLNLKCGTSYKATSNKTKACINARLNEDFTLEDFKKVIDIKATEWLNTDMQKYLRPETLFGNKFESYLNQKQQTKQQPQQPKPNKFHNFIQHDEIDLNAIAEKKREEAIKKINGSRSSQINK